MLTNPTLDQMQALGLTGMAAAWRELTEQSSTNELSRDEWLGLMLDREVTLRADKRIRNRLASAKLRFAQACIEDIDFAAARGLDRRNTMALAQGQWLTAHEGLIITGHTGTGKSWLTCAFGRQAARLGHSVLYVRVPRMFEDLAIARLDGSHHRLIDRLTRVQLLILDDFGTHTLSDQQRFHLFEIVEERYQRKSTLITAQVPVASWHDLIAKRATVDALMGPKSPKSTVLTPAEEAMVVAFRQKTLLPLDDVLGCLRNTIPNLSRSALHRCLQRHGISRLPVEETKERRKRFKSYEIGYVRIDRCELRHADGKLVMFLAIDRVSKFIHVEFHGCAGKMEGADFLRNVVEVFPYKIHTVLTDNGMAFADLPKNRSGPSRRFLGPHIFDRVCIANRIEHRLTKPYHPWTNGQAERMNRTIKDATVKVYHYDDLESLKAHVMAFVTAYNFAKHLKALRWRTPYQAICDAWTKDPSIFKINPHQLIPGLHT